MPVHLSSLVAGLIVLFALMGTQLKAAELTGKALLASDQKTPVAGVLVVVSSRSAGGTLNRVGTTNTGSDGTFAVRCPDDVRGPIIVRYSKVAHWIIVDTEIRENIAENSGKLIPVYVLPKDEGLDAIKVALILEQRSRASGNPHSQIKADYLALKEAGFKEAGLDFEMLRDGIVKAAGLDPEYIGQ